MDDYLVPVWYTGSFLPESLVSKYSNEQENIKLVALNRTLKTLKASGAMIAMINLPMVIVGYIIKLKY